METKKIPEKLLSPKLLSIIEQNPTQTILRGEKGTEELYSKLKKIKLGLYGNIPDKFDGRIAWKGLLIPVFNQGKCGSCWAFASTSMLSNRFNIHSLGKLHIQLSPAKMILCDWQGKEFSLEHPEDTLYLSAIINKKGAESTSCYGNTLVDACRYLYQIGVPTEDCVPYSKKLGVYSNFDKISDYKNMLTLPLCKNVTGPLGDMCSDFALDKKTGEEFGTPARFFKALHFYGVSGVEKDQGSEYYIRQDIFKWGPIATGMKVYPDFYTFDAKNDIYAWNGQESQVGGHAIQLIGWGKENNIEYWIAKNSWGDDWGDRGYFRIKRGVNMCDIEENCVGVIPDFFYPPNYGKDNEDMYDINDSVKSIRKNISSSLDIFAGGIDTEIGYSRRVIAQKSWLNLKPLIMWEKVPDWKYFIAGIEADVKNRDKSIIKYYGKDSKKKSYFNIIFFIIFGTCIIIIVILFLSRNRKNKKLLV